MVVDVVLLDVLLVSDDMASLALIRKIQPNKLTDQKSKVLKTCTRFACEATLLAF